MTTWNLVQPTNEQNLDAAELAYCRALDRNAITEPGRADVDALLDRVRQLDRGLAFDLSNAIDEATLEAGRLGFRAAFGDSEK